MQKLYGFTLKNGLLFALLGLLLFSCKSNKGKAKEEEVNIDSTELSQSLTKDVKEAKKVFYSLPTPLEIAVLIKKTGVQYNESLLNPVGNVTNYTTNKVMALNLGVYTMDLSFASLFDQTQTAINYMNTVKKLANGLGILDAVDDNTIKRLEENIHNREIVMDIISETFMSSSSFLKENDRPAVAAIVLVGGWVEGLYLATQLVGNNPVKGNKMAARIAEQKLNQDIVISLLDEYKGNPDVASVLVQVRKIKSVFDKIKINSSKVVPEVDKKSNVTTLKSKITVNFTQATFNELKVCVKNVRHDFIF
ncbi:MAG: hypothetical protein Q8907_14710 [Bacteroidota bacterium]|nr:hypothetical protein [Bacteroidota bacterium]MDP4226276.1 hypothetical protein [Bacteroidota bacterium]MDP4275523.1 hypothetical protein [Bacteroidota bacterium]